MKPQKIISLLTAHKNLKAAGYISNIPEETLKEWRKVARKFKQNYTNDLENIKE